MNREERKNAASRNGVEIGFMDPSNMSGSMQALYLLSIFGAIFGALYIFYVQMVKGPEDAE